ncbi:MAG: DnaJ domain-containing protein [Alphaproteobacteria bacterium]|nr:DnaJ domain-containing protein [Alphaproteobacteria bacterium]
MTKICEAKNCKEAATHKAPKSRTLKSYWNFCKKHAAEYNQNWNFYEGMTAAEIEKDWQQRTFGCELEEGAKRNYKDIINDILSGKTVDYRPNPNFPKDICKAFETLGIAPARDEKLIKKAYLILAKKHHPDSAESKDTEKFKQISEAFANIQKFLKA